MVFELPKLDFEFDELEPWLDARTMEIHYLKHHKTYCDKFNSVLEKHPELFKKSAAEILTELSKIPEDIRNAVRNFGGGYYSKSNFFRFLINIINDMHHWYHWAGVKYPEISKFCSGIHIHDSITVFDKSPVPEPTHSHIPLN